MVVGERAEEREKKTFVVCTVTVCTHVRVHTYTCMYKYILLSIIIYYLLQKCIMFYL